MKREYPYGRVRQDTVSQPIQYKDYAYLCREIMERVTGEECDVVPRGRNHFYLVRLVGEEKWVRA